MSREMAIEYYGIMLKYYYRTGKGLSDLCDFALGMISKYKITTEEMCDLNKKILF